MQADQAHLVQAVYAQRAPLLTAINRVAPWLALHRRRTLEILDSRFTPTSAVLDLACGTGILASSYVPKVRHATLTDLLPAMIALARESLDKLGPARSVEYHVAAVDALPAAVLARKYELILLTQALNFFENVSGVFDVAAACLAPGGVLHIDIDNPMRWVIVEALSGHLDNAQAIAAEGRDVARNIVGANYWFHTRRALIDEATARGLQLRAEFGICTVASLLHIFNPSRDFLNPDSLNPRARLFLEAANIDSLYKLDATLEGLVPPEAAGWTVLQFTRGET